MTNEATVEIVKEIEQQIENKENSNEFELETIKSFKEKRNAMKRALKNIESVGEYYTNSIDEVRKQLPTAIEEIESHMEDSKTIIKDNKAAIKSLKAAIKALQ